MMPPELFFETTETPSARWSEARVAAWVRETCLMFGTSQKTAHAITAIFLERLENDGIKLRGELP